MNRGYFCITNMNREYFYIANMNRGYFYITNMNRGYFYLTGSWERAKKKGGGGRGGEMSKTETSLATVPTGLKSYRYLETLSVLKTINTKICLCDYFAVTFYYYVSRC